jgi:hypothetical protein
MKPAGKQYKFINSETGYAIYYYTLKTVELASDKIKEELEKVKAQVAIKYNIFVGTVYWEEIKED